MSGTKRPSSRSPSGTGQSKRRRTMSCTEADIDNTDVQLETPLTSNSFSSLIPFAAGSAHQLQASQALMDYTAPEAQLRQSSPSASPPQSAPHGHGLSTSEVTSSPVAAHQDGATQHFHDAGMGLDTNLWPAGISFGQPHVLRKSIFDKNFNPSHNRLRFLPPC